MGYIDEITKVFNIRISATCDTSDPHAMWRHLCHVLRARGSVSSHSDESGMDERDYKRVLMPQSYTATDSAGFNTRTHGSLPVRPSEEPGWVYVGADLAPSGYAAR